MEHYDGPAFYRKFPVKPTPVQHEEPLTQRAASQVKHRQERNARTQREAEAAHAAVKNLQPTTTTKSQPSQPASGSYRPFQVTEIPRQLHWSSQQTTPQRQRYQRLIDRLHKPLASFFTFGQPGETAPASETPTVVFTPSVSSAATSGSTTSLTASATTQLATPTSQAIAEPARSAQASEQSVTNQSAKMSISTQPPVSASLSATTVTTSTVTAAQFVEPIPTEIIYPSASATRLEVASTTDPVSAATSSVSDVTTPTRRPVDYLPVGTPVAAPKAVKTTAVADVSESESKTSTSDRDVQRLLDRTEESTASAPATGSSQSLSTSQATEPVNTTSAGAPTSATATQVSASASATPSQTSAAPTPKAKPRRGLGMALGDIMQEEGNDQRDLALFADAPTTAPVTPTEAAPTRGYHFPDLSLLPKPVIPDEAALDEWIEHQGEVLDATLQAFHVDAHVTDWTVGPTVTQFQISLALGVKVNKITNLNDDLKLALAAKDIRIEAPIPGKTTVGIEIPNLKSRPVMLSEILNSTAFKQSDSPLTVALGVDLFGKPQVTDLRKMPHGLIAGATGSGKSVFINSLLLSILYKANPQQVKLLLIDPKAVEMAPYDGLPHLLAPVISDPKAAAAALKWVVTEMDQRYEKLAAAGVRNIEQFNDRADANDEPGLKMPYIVIIIDELADLMMMAASEVQDYIVRITQKARAAGIHLLVATQRPSVDIVTGTIKNNIPTRIAFMVSSQIDSRTILDTTGAESLLGRGDMLYLGNGASQPMRLQGAYVEAEVDRVTDFVRTQGKPQYAFEPKGLLQKETNEENQDELLPEVLQYISQEKTVSTSKLQRVFSIGYNRAANLIDDLEQRHYVSPQHGSKPREVYLTPDDLGKDLPEPHDQGAPFSS
ncbi:DNA translocase FtsK [Levilactobacillus acidifarinae]|uniref:DNA translocase FtsK n=1 Tax=Levilactobacillus acidifarinae DSM 19394 = JCM 15949 TaxID=1423715 RepID=A0A0R1LEP3_9LACO|nr:DNA translocase FtsK [Levilactobacillus acidifarinae]KRK94283.1 DNA segregation ATPase FtsK SpoIIIE related protein [Levilactobacillus acidifarinae DSM 19394]GEO69928.1 cell division protein FtsK [Levilactobacillus acidifarinae]